MDDIYSFLRKLQTQIVAPTSYVDPEANGLLQSDSLGPAYQYGDLLKGTPYDTKFSGAMKQVEPGLYMANFQDPGKDKYSTLSAYYRIDPETGMAEMQGDPFQTRQTSKRETVKDFLEHGVPLIAAAVGAGYAVNGLGAAGAAGSGSGLSAGAYGGAGALGDAGLLTAAGGSGFAGAGTSTLGSLAGTMGTGAGYGAGIAGGLDALAGVGSSGLAGGSGLSTGTAGGSGLKAGGSTATGLGSTGLGSTGGAGSGLLSSLTSGEVSPWLRAAAGLYGAYEGSQEQPGAQASNQRTLDPRIDSRVFGPGGLMESADAQFQKNKATGQNETMVQAQDWLRGLLTSPEMQQGLRSQYNASQGLFNMAPNPFKWGG